MNKWSIIFSPFFDTINHLYFILLFAFTSSRALANVNNVNVTANVIDNASTLNISLTVTADLITFNLGQLLLS